MNWKSRVDLLRACYRKQVASRIITMLLLLTSCQRSPDVLAMPGDQRVSPNSSDAEAFDAEAQLVQVEGKDTGTSSGGRQLDANNVATGSSECVRRANEIGGDDGQSVAARCSSDRYDAAHGNRGRCTPQRATLEHVLAKLWRYLSSRTALLRTRRRAGNGIAPLQRLKSGNLAGNRRRAQ